MSDEQKIRSLVDRSGVGWGADSIRTNRGWEGQLEVSQDWPQGHVKALGLYLIDGRNSQLGKSKSNQCSRKGTTVQQDWKQEYV